MTQPKIIDRIRKLLELSKSDNEHEAAQAGARAAQLMGEHAITEAMVKVTGEDDAANEHVTERIAEDNLGPDMLTKTRVAWRDRVASSVARSLDCETYTSGGNLYAFGRESNVSAWRYTSAYLIREIDRLADRAWLDEGADLAAVGRRPKTWKGAFRLGAADVVANRLFLSKKERIEQERATAERIAGELTAGAGSDGTSQPVVALVPVSQALSRLTAGRAEISAKFKAKTSGPGWRSQPAIGNSTRGRSGYEAGRAAGKNVPIGGARAALKG